MFKHQPTIFQELSTISHYQQHCRHHAAITAVSGCHFLRNRCRWSSSHCAVWPSSQFVVPQGFELRKALVKFNCLLCLRLNWLVVKNLVWLCLIYSVLLYSVWTWWDYLWQSFAPTAFLFLFVSINIAWAYFGSFTIMNSSYLFLNLGSWRPQNGKTRHVSPKQLDVWNPKCFLRVRLIL